MMNQIKPSHFTIVSEVSKSKPLRSDSTLQLSPRPLERVFKKFLKKEVLSLSEANFHGFIVNTLNFPLSFSVSSNSFCSSSKKWVLPSPHLPDMPKIKDPFLSFE